MHDINLCVSKISNIIKQGRALKRDVLLAVIFKDSLPMTAIVINCV